MKSKMLDQIIQQVPVSSFLTVSEAAAYLRITKSTLYNWVHNSRVPYRKHGGLLVFHIEDLNQWSKSQEVVEKTRSGFVLSTNHAINPHPKKTAGRSLKIESKPLLKPS